MRHVQPYIPIFLKVGIVSFVFISVSTCAIESLKKYFFRNSRVRCEELAYKKEKKKIKNKKKNKESPRYQKLLVYKILVERRKLTIESVAKSQGKHSRSLTPLFERRDTSGHLLFALESGSEREEGNFQHACKKNNIDSRFANFPQIREQKRKQKRNTGYKEEA